MDILGAGMVISGALMMGWSIAETWPVRLMIAGALCISAGALTLLR